MENFEVIKALFLGFVEGLTEFLPISSTGHLILFGHIIDFHSDGGRVFEVVIQLGAILAVCWLYRQKIINLIKGFLAVMWSHVILRLVCLLHSFQQSLLAF